MDGEFDAAYGGVYAYVEGHYHSWYMMMVVIGCGHDHGHCAIAGDDDEAHLFSQAIHPHTLLWTFSYLEVRVLRIEQVSDHFLVNFQETALDDELCASGILTDVLENVAASSWYDACVMCEKL